MILEVHFSIPGQGEQQVLLGENSPLKVGSLLSNQVVLPLLGVEPIHALFELRSDGHWLITDLGSDAGVFLNGKKIDVEAEIQAGDQLKLGTALLRVTVQRGAEVFIAPPPPPPPGLKGSAELGVPKPPLPAVLAPTPQAPSPSAEQEEGASFKPLLFTPVKNREAGSGEILEVVAYWGETIVEVEHFHPRLQGFSTVTIGDHKSCHFIAATSEKLRKHVLARVQEAGYSLQLLEGMTARLRRGGQVSQVSAGQYNLAVGDIADVHFGAVRYFFLFMRPPQVQLPPLVPRDPFFRGLVLGSLLLYLVSTIGLWLITPKPLENLTDDAWTIVHVPEKKSPPPAMKVPPVAVVKTEPPPLKEPPAPAPKPVTAADPQEKAKPVPPPARQQQPQPSMGDNLNKAREAPPASAAPQAVAAAKSNPEVGGGGRPPEPGGARKGEGQAHVMGVENAGNQKAAGVNLSKLGLGVGKISSLGGPGAIHTKFQNSAGGAGGGQGAAKATFGLGGLDSPVKSLGLSGATGSLNRFGAGSGANSLLGDSKNAGGAFGDGKKAAQVNIRAGDPLVSGGLTQQEILAVIRTHLNEIRHCYEKLLQRSPSASGLIKVQFVVGLDGRVSSAQIASATIADPSLGSCVTGVVQRWTFPAPRGGSAVTVNYPFTFNPL